MLKVGLMLAMVLGTIGTVPNATRVVHYPGGKAVLVTRSDGSQSVTVYGAHGGLNAQSECDSRSGRYDRIVTFATAVKRAARQNDGGALIGMMRFPLRVNVAPNRGFTIANRAILVKRFASVFAPAIVTRLAQLDPRDVFCRNGRSMLADGAIWAAADRSGVLKGEIVNLERR